MSKSDNTIIPISRRKFISHTSMGLGALMVSPLTEVLAKGAGRKLGVALVGLGNYAGGQLAPALLETKNCYLAGIVTGTKSKEKVWQDKYNIPSKNIYNYDNFDDIAKNKDIDIVYVVLPNGMHAEYSIRAAKAGKHVVSEKPMAVSVAECQQVINACKDEGVKLGMGYRMHYEPFNLEMMRLGQRKVYGQVKSIRSEFRFKMGNLAQWRTDKKLAGGGPLMDLGVYCIQGVIYTLGELPISVQAKNTTRDKSAWTSVEGSLEWSMKFPSGVKVNCKSSYEEEYLCELVAEAEKGDFSLKPAFIYGDLQGKTPKGKMNFENVNQQALQMDAFAASVLHNTENLVPGEMGMRDMQIIEKIYESMHKGGKEVSCGELPEVLHRV